MRELFPTRRDGDGNFARCRKFFQKHCHPACIGTGALFGTVGLGVSAAGLMYADGLNFAVQNFAGLPDYIMSGGNLTESVEYIRESYKSSISGAYEAAWKLVPFYYCVGHWVGGKFRDSVAKAFGRR